MSFRRAALWLGLAVSILSLPAVQEVIPTGWGPQVTAFTAAAGLILDWMRHNVPGQGER